MHHQGYHCTLFHFLCEHSSPYLQGTLLHLSRRVVEMMSDNNNSSGSSSSNPLHHLPMTMATSANDPATTSSAFIDPENRNSSSVMTKDRTNTMSSADKLNFVELYKEENSCLQEMKSNFDYVLINKADTEVSCTSSSSFP